MIGNGFDFMEALAGRATITIDNGALFDELQRFQP